MCSMIFFYQPKSRESGEGVNTYRVSRSIVGVQEAHLLPHTLNRGGVEGVEPGLLAGGLLDAELALGDEPLQADMFVGLLAPLSHPLLLQQHL